MDRGEGHPVVAGAHVEARLAPRDDAEAAAALKAAKADGHRVLVRGRGTKDAYGAPLAGPFLLLESSNLARVRRYRPEDLTITVEAGMRLGDLEAVLAEHGQTLGWDVPGGEEATLGGALATGIDGPRQAVRGRLRDDVLEVEALIGTGEIVRSGAPVVKNVAGYDLNRLWAGSFGALGFVLALTLKVRPRPRLALTHRLRLADADEAALWRDLVAGLPSVAGAVLLGSEGAVLGVTRLEGRPKAVEEALAALPRGEVLEDPEGLHLLRSCLHPQPEAPVLFLAAAPEEVPTLLFRSLGDQPTAAAGDVLLGSLRRSVTPEALQEPPAGRPYRWEGAAPLLGGRRPFGPPSPEEAFWPRLLDAFDPAAHFARERLLPDLAPRREEALA